MPFVENQGSTESLNNTPGFFGIELTLETQHPLGVIRGEMFGVPAPSAVDAQ
jgi:hypothetical protein